MCTRVYISLAIADLPERNSPETLMLQDDPAFIPELALYLPEINIPFRDDSQLVTQLLLEDKTLLPENRSISISPGLTGGPSPENLIIPQSSSVNNSGIGFQPFLRDLSAEERFEEDADFVFDENGEMHSVADQSRITDLILEQDLGQHHEHLPVDDQLPSPSRLQRWDSMSITSDRVRREHEEGQGILNVGI
jgi:hypothetical protein